MKHIALMAATAAFVTFGAASAFADECSGHNHDTGTALGAVGGAAIGGLASHSVVGAVVGGVAGGFAGNAIARSGDCDHPDNHAQARAYNEGYRDRAAEDHGAAADAYADGYHDRGADERQARQDDYPH